MAQPSTFGQRFAKTPPGTARASAKNGPATQGQSSIRKWWVLLAMVFGLFMPLVGNLVVSVALPAIEGALGARDPALEWIIDAYTLTFASFILMGGSLGDVYGRKRWFIAGLVLFTLGSLASALSGSVGLLIGFRAVQGLGAALLLPGSLSILTATFDQPQRGAAIGIWAALSGLAVAVGPLLGGYLLENYSWQYIFLMNIPLGLIALVIAALAVKESKDPSPSRKLDPIGLFTGTAAMVFLVYALVQGGNRGWTDRLILTAVGAAAIVLIAFLIIESKRRSPMLPLTLFRDPTFSGSNAVAASVFFALFGTTIFLGLYLQTILGLSAFYAGARLLPFAAVILLISPFAGRLSDRHGSRWLMTVGCAAAAGGMALLLRTNPASDYETIILPAFLVLGAGLSLTLAPMTAAVMGSVHERYFGVASAATNTIRELGSVVGVALLGAVVTAGFKNRLHSALVPMGLSGPASDSITTHTSSSAGRGASFDSVRELFPPDTPSRVIADVVSAAQQSFVESIHTAMWIAIGFLLLASVVAAIFVRSHVRRAPAAEEGPKDNEVPESPKDASVPTTGAGEGALASSQDRSLPEVRKDEAAEAAASVAQDEDTAQMVASSVRAAMKDMPAEAIAPQPQNEGTPLSEDASSRHTPQRFKNLLFELPFKAGDGRVEDNLTDFLLGALPYLSDDLAENPMGITLPVGASRNVQGTTSYDIAVLAGYLALEQRFGRIKRNTPPEQAATVLLGAARALSLWTVNVGQGGVTRQFVEGMVRLVVSGIGTSDDAPRPQEEQRSQGEGDTDLQGEGDTDLQGQGDTDLQGESDAAPRGQDEQATPGEKAASLIPAEAEPGG
ncbi:MAG: MFS transporter [Actinomycetota bacterium]|nr:MFS transporter [Actinomycetota bacterium]